jgi:outer membrane protein TolC
MMISMKRYIILIFAVLLLLPGCNLYKKYDSKANTITGNLMGYVMNPQDTLSIGDMSWRDVFKDPNLQSLIETALVNNTDMRTAQLTIEQAQNVVRSAKWGYAPTLSFSPNASYNYQGGAGGYSVQIPVRASWQLGIFGQNRSKVRSAKAKLAYDEDLRQAVQVDLAANVANLYYTLVMLDRQLAISEATEILYQESYNTTQALFQAGTYNSPAVYEMQASLEALRADIVDLRYSIAST